MSEAIVFKGGWLDIVGLLRGLAGRPLRAEIEESCTLNANGSTLRRTGQVNVDRQRRFRLDVEEEGRPPVMFLHDPNRREMIIGVADQPETWTRMPWIVSLPPERASARDPERELRIEMEFSDEIGHHRYRLFNARYEDPDKGMFPAP
jgi:hypothetical protein